MILLLLTDFEPAVPTATHPQIQFVGGAPPAPRPPARGWPRLARETAPRFTPSPRTPAQAIMPPTEDQELFRAAESGDSARVEKLLKSGDNPVVADKYGNTPLMLACEFGHAKSVGLLLRHNALVSDRNHHGEAALIFASVGGHTLCAQQLLDARANVNEADAENHTPLIRAAQFGHDAVVRLLCRRGADVTASTSTTGDTALMLAARPGHFRAVQFLLVRGALVPLLSSRSPVRPALLYALASTQARGVRAAAAGAAFECFVVACSSQYR